MQSQRHLVKCCCHYKRVRTWSCLNLIASSTLLLNICKPKARTIHLPRFITGTCAVEILSAHAHERITDLGSSKGHGEYMSSF